MSGRGRGVSSTLPAWMTEGQTTAPGKPPGAVQKRWIHHCPQCSARCSGCSCSMQPGMHAEPRVLMRPPVFLCVSQKQMLFSGSAYQLRDLRPGQAESCARLALCALHALQSESSLKAQLRLCIRMLTHSSAGPPPLLPQPPGPPTSQPSAAPSYDPSGPPGPPGPPASAHDVSTGPHGPPGPPSDAPQLQAAPGAESDPDHRSGTTRYNLAGLLNLHADTSVLTSHSRGRISRKHEAHSARSPPGTVCDHGRNLRRTAEP